MDGTISISKILDNPASVNSGGLGAEISSSSNLGNTSITRGSAIQSANGNSSIKRYYDITPTTNTGLNASFVFHYDPVDLNGLTESELVLFKSIDNGITWTQEGGTVNTTNHTVALDGINSFSRWTLGSSAAPLPVELTSFTANVIDNKKIQLNWQTATEVNNYGFEVERQASSSTTHGQKGYKKIGFVNGNGNSNSPKLYSFTDNKLIGGSDFAYRLKQIDIDGNFKYSDIVTVCVIPVKYKLSQNYPNPFNPTTKISYEIPENGFVSLKVFNELGKEVRTLVKKNQQPGKYEISFDATGIASGIYFARLHVNNYTKIVKMILLK
ncbi:MAG: T9SS type A sorting domain-containing protein [Chlorobi bacterium]|nr:T9SS type A sorting domain-containing protein [Chlorobiota bacterium]